MIRRPPRSTHCISSAASDVYKRQIIGFIHSSYLLGKSDDLPLDSFIDSGFYTSENNLASNLLNEIRKSKLNLAIVGERSSSSGIVTLEDILEEVIGEIEDEHD